MSETEDSFNEEMQCYQCLTGTVLKHRSGWQCFKCKWYFCEGCCDEGLFTEDDYFWCKKCFHQMYLEILKKETTN